VTAFSIDELALIDLARILRLVDENKKCDICHGSGVLWQQVGHAFIGDTCQACDARHAEIRRLSEVDRRLTPHCLEKRDA
jgi:hypothetical protein